MPVIFAHTPLSDGEFDFSIYPTLYTPVVNTTTPGHPSPWSLPGFEPASLQFSSRKISCELNTIILINKDLNAGPLLCSTRPKTNGLFFLKITQKKWQQKAWMTLLSWSLTEDKMMWITTLEANVLKMRTVLVTNQVGLWTSQGSWSSKRPPVKSFLLTNTTGPWFQHSRILTSLSHWLQP